MQSSRLLSTSISQSDRNFLNKLTQVTLIEAAFLIPNIQLLKQSSVYTNDVLELLSRLYALNPAVVTDFIRLKIANDRGHVWMVNCALRVIQQRAPDLDKVLLLKRIMLPLICNMVNAIEIGNAVVNIYEADPLFLNEMQFFTLMRNYKWSWPLAQGLKKIKDLDSFLKEKIFAKFVIKASGEARAQHNHAIWSSSLADLIMQIHAIKPDSLYQDAIIELIFLNPTLAIEVGRALTMLEPVLDELCEERSFYEVFSLLVKQSNPIESVDYPIKNADALLLDHQAKVDQKKAIIKNLTSSSYLAGLFKGMGVWRSPTSVSELDMVEVKKTPSP